MPAQRCASILVLSAALLCACSGPEENPPADRVTIDAEQDAAVDSGRVEVLTFERSIIRRRKEGRAYTQRSISLPQFAGEIASVQRINASLRHLALHWPTLPQPGRDSPAEVAALMREVGDQIATIDPGECPTMTELESLDGLLSDTASLGESMFSHDEAYFSITIVRLDAEIVVLHLEILDATGATTHDYEGELTLDLRTGKAINPR